MVRCMLIVFILRAVALNYRLLAASLYYAVASPSVLSHSVFLFRQMRIRIRRYSYLYAVLHLCL